MLRLEIADLCVRKLHAQNEISREPLNGGLVFLIYPFLACDSPPHAEALVPASTMTWSSLDDSTVTECNSYVMKTYPLGSGVVDDGGYSYCSH